MSGRSAPKRQVVAVPAAVVSMSLVEIAAELRADRLNLEQAHAALTGRPSLSPTWRPGDPLGPASASQPTTPTNACPQCGSLISQQEQPQCR